MLARVDRWLCRRHPRLSRWRSNMKFASHLPTLLAVGRLAQPAHVLELGCGRFSTASFLDRRYFPSVASLHSVEDNASWAKDVENRLKDDPRLHLQSVASVEEFVRNSDISAYDLILIDDSSTPEQRARTIRQVLKKASRHSVIVVHDIEQPEYWPVVPEDALVFNLSALYPTTGVIGSGRIERGDLMRAVRRTRLWSFVPPNWLAVWSRVHGRGRIGAPLVSFASS